MWAGIKRETNQPHEGESELIRLFLFLNYCIQLAASIALFLQNKKMRKYNRLIRV